MIAVIAVLFALACGGTLAGLTALEQLLDQHGAAPKSHPRPLF